MRIEKEQKICNYEQQFTFIQYRLKLNYLKQKRDNPYKSTIQLNLYNFTSGQLVDPDLSAKFWDFSTKIDRVLDILRGDYLKKCKKLDQTIEYLNVPVFCIKKYN